MRSPSENSNIIKYADDTAIVGLIGNNCETWCSDANEYAIQRCTANHLDLSVTKTKEIHYFRKTSSIKTSVIVDDIP